MKSMFKLADYLDIKLKKIAQSTGEVDSSNVTIAVRPAVNDIVQSNNALSNIVQGIANKIIAANPSLRGKLIVNDIIINANLVGNKWKINPSTSGLKATGTLVQDPVAAGIIKKALAPLNLKIFAKLEQEFNRISQMDPEGWKGNKITNHETAISGSDVELKD